MDDIDSYYTERPAYPRPPPPGNRSYPPPHMMQNRPPYGRPQGPPRMGPPGPRMGPGLMGGPMGGPMGRPRGPSMGQRPGQGPPRMGGPGRPMGPGPMNGRPMPPLQGPPPVGALPRRPQSPAGRPPMGAHPRPESPFREPPSMGALARRPESPFREPPSMGGNPRPESPAPYGRPAGPPPTAALPPRPESHAEPSFAPTRDMVPAPLNLRRSPPPQEPLETPQRRPSPAMNSPRPLDSIGALRMRSPSPNPNAMVRPLDSIGAPRPPRSSSARPAENRSPNLLAPEWENHNRQRSASADDHYRREDFVPAPLAPLRTASPEILGSDAHQPVSPRTMLPIQGPTTFGIDNPTRPAQARQHQPKSDDIVLGADFIEEITVGPYQDLDHPPPLPRKNSVKPSMISQILAPQRLPSPGPQRMPSPAPPTKQILPPTPEDESPLPSDRGLRSMWLGDIQAGPYQQSDAPPMPLPLRSSSRSPPLDTPDMSEPPSDSEDNFNDAALPPLFAGLRIQTGSEQIHTLAPTTYNPHESSSTNASAGPSTPGDNRDSYATDVCETEITIDESSPMAENGDLPAKTPRKHVPSMCEYMSMDQLEDLWGKEDQFGATGYFSFDPTPVAMADDGPSGTPF